MSAASPIPKAVPTSMKQPVMSAPKSSKQYSYKNTAKLSSSSTATGHDGKRQQTTGSRPSASTSNDSGTGSQKHIKINEATSPSALLDSLFEFTRKDGNPGFGTPWRSRQLPKSFFNQPIGNSPSRRATTVPGVDDTKPTYTNGRKLSTGRPMSPQKLKATRKPKGRCKSVSLDTTSGFKPIKEVDSVVLSTSDHSFSTNKDAQRRAHTPKTPQNGKRASPAIHLPLKPKKRTRPAHKNDTSNHSVVAPPSLEKKLDGWDFHDILDPSHKDDMFSKLTNEFDAATFGELPEEPVTSFKWREPHPETPICETPIPTTLDEASEELDMIEGNLASDYGIFESIDFPSSGKGNRSYSCPDLRAEMNAFSMYTGEEQQTVSDENDEDLNGFIAESMHLDSVFVPDPQEHDEKFIDELPFAV